MDEAALPVRRAGWGGMRGKQRLGRGGRYLLLASSSVAALLIGGGAPAAFAACNTSYSNTTAPGCSNAATITGIAINNSTITGSITNSGTITPNGIVLTNGSTIAGSIVDTGTLGGGIAIDRTSTITQNSNSQVAIAIDGASFAGGISNAGLLSVGYFGRYILVGAISRLSPGTVTTFSGGISNSGTLTGLAGGGILIENTINFSGGITNSGLIYARSDNAINVTTVSSFGGGIVNSGTIATDFVGILVGGSAGTFTGGITNSGTISGIVDLAAGIEAQNLSIFAGGISNSGLIGGSSSGTAIAVSAIASFSGGISNSGTISVGGDGIAVSNISNFSGGISNSGMIAGAASRSQSQGVITVVRVSTFSGGITNSGTISASGPGAAIAVQAVTSFLGGISNSGVISAAGRGIIVLGNTSNSTNATSTFSGGIANSGTISAGGDGIGLSAGVVPGFFSRASQVFATFAGGVSNSGVISAGGNGIFVGGTGVSNNSDELLTFAGGISNSGMISAAGDGIFVGGRGTSAARAAVTISNFSGGISNSGMISAGGQGIVVGGKITSANNLTVTISTFSGGIINSGSILARTGIAVTSAVQTFLGAIVNSGTVTGSGGTAIDVSGANNAITIDQTAGLIAGAIKLSAHADVLNISGGTINGNVVGQGSANTVDFALGSAPFTYASPYAMTGLNLVNFNTGTAYIDGSIQATTIAINNGGTAAGTGTFTGPVTVMAGGTLMPGEPLGTLHIAGSLTFDTGSDYGVHIAPGANNNSATTVTGAANLNGNGTVEVTPQIGHYTPNDYVILTAAPRNGTFAGLVVNGDFAGSIALDYSVTNEVLLDVSGSALFATPPGAGQNQQNVLNGINNAILAGDTLPPGFQNLGNLSGPALLNALTQLSGEAATDAGKGAFQMMTEFLDLMLDPSAGGGGSAGGGAAPGFAPEQEASLPPDIALAYNRALKKPPPQPAAFEQRWNAWGSAFGGTNKSDGDTTVGSNNVTAS
ncbi:MAG TPA: hypothetical protein VGH13_22475, partial [Xanthobacteraceae bacterium]